MEQSRSRPSSTGVTVLTHCPALCLAPCSSRLGYFAVFPTAGILGRMHKKEREVRDVVRVRAVHIFGKQRRWLASGLFKSAVPGCSCLRAHPSFGLPPLASQPRTHRLLCGSDARLPGIAVAMSLSA